MSSLQSLSFGWQEEEEFTEDEFFGLDVLDIPPDSIDDSFQYLNQQDLLSIANPSQIEWEDRPISNEDENVTFLLDQSRKEGWAMLKDEVEHFRTAIPLLLATDLPRNIDVDQSSAVNSFHPPSLKKLLMLAFGQQSEFSATFCRELKLHYVTYLKFMGMVCLQMAYRETPLSLYDDSSLLKDKVRLKKILFWLLF